ncbi:thioesterase II family protein [Streptantibioticus ferralitis]|uniref:Alpha/beta fold hydrolase n=1 Tax=Streptantibioticus ferralitis TaxID=236510 RepID=A0ABT5ZCD7_9ACTN|nr:alpha/beta fold hydrolase [Streptantibioticus ferralitis]MDF2261509.1 alpha/beta fold hydrolase [Streptantibioticus ferralitis]
MSDVPKHTARRWLANRRKRPEAAIRLYCFAHSGGSAAEYVRWGDDLPDIEVWGIQLPGRGSRLDDPLYTRVGPLIEDLVEQAGFQGPFAFFGHSLGALLAYETARALDARGLPGPERLLLSACPAPHRPRGLPPIHHLGDRDLFAAIQRQYASLPDEVAEDPDLLAIVMASHRGDFELVDSYRHTPGDPLDLPLHVFGGAEDRLTAGELGQWQDHSRGPFSLHLLPGGHFYLREQRTALLELIQTALADRRHAESPVDALSDDL